MDAQTQKPVFDRTTQDVGNMVELGHVNVRVPDQRIAILFYIQGLGLTRDPYLMVGVDNMWVNVGISQFHLPLGPAQVLRGTTGLVTEESNESQYRFERITDLDTGATLAVIEHEVRSMRHPMFARAMVNRNPEQTNNHYAPGREAWTPSMPPA